MPALIFEAHRKSVSRLWFAGKVKTRIRFNTIANQFAYPSHRCAAAPNHNDTVEP